MTRDQRLVRIQASLTPKQAVLLWLKEEHQGKTSSEYLRWMMERPTSAAPRPRVQRQVVDAIRKAMKGQDPSRVEQAVREAQMQTDFLILLVNRSNWVILDGSEARALRILLFCELIRNAIHADDGRDAVSEWAGGLRLFATELFALQTATELIRERYFDGHRILLKDATEDLEHAAKFVRNLIGVYDLVVSEDGQSELAIDCENFRNAAHERASAKADYIVALAKSQMLDDFGEAEAADAIIKPYFLEQLTEGGPMTRLPSKYATPSR